MEFSRSPTRCISKARCEQESLQVRHVLSVLFLTKDRRLYGDFLGSQRCPKDRLQICRLAFIFIRRGHGELLHTRRFRESDPRPAEQCFLRERSQATLFRDFEIRKKLVCCPHFFEMGRNLSSRYRIARGEQALLAVSVVLSLTRWPACSPHLQRGLRS